MLTGGVVIIAIILNRATIAIVSRDSTWRQMVSLVQVSIPNVTLVLFLGVSLNLDITNYNPPTNFCQLSLDKTDHVIQNRTMVIRGHPPSDLISVVSSYFDGRKTKKRANVPAKLLIGHGKQNLEKPFCRSQ